MSNNNLRLYSFSHSWLSTVQKGIQSRHATIELLNTHVVRQTNSSHKRNLVTWMNDDKTMIDLEGGNSKTLREMFEFVFQHTSFACAKFHEDQDSLEGIMTSFVVLLPDTFWDRTEEDFLDFWPEKYLPFFRYMKSAHLVR